jgi:hypothetical protein
MDTEWHGVEWEIGKLEIAFSAAVWLVVGVIVAVNSGSLLGIFALFLLGTAVAAAVVLGIVWLRRNFRINPFLTVPLDMRGEKKRG